MFKRIAQAYEVLSDTKRRAEYDRHGQLRSGGHQHQQTGAHRRRTTPAEFAAGFGHFRSPFDIFHEFFGDPFGFGDPMHSPLFAAFNQQAHHPGGRRSECIH
jgi:DnaJ-class molecular chaperone